MSDREQGERRPEPEYEPPALEDVESPEGPAMTSTGTPTITITTAKPTR